MLVVLIGHLSQKSPFEKTVSGTLKAGIGFLVISSGSNIVTGALKVFEPLWSEVFVPPSAVLTNCMGYDAFVGKFGKRDCHRYGNLVPDQCDTGKDYTI